jgi:hypothetical protein
MGYWSVWKHGKQYSESRTNGGGGQSAHSILRFQYGLYATSFGLDDRNLRRAYWSGWVIDLLTDLVLELGPDTAHLMGFQIDQFRFTSSGEHRHSVAFFQGGVGTQRQTLNTVSKHLPRTDRSKLLGSNDYAFPLHRHR